MPLHVLSAPDPALRSVLAALRSAAAVRGTRLPTTLPPVRGTLRPELSLPVHELTRVSDPQSSLPDGPDPGFGTGDGTGAGAGAALCAPLTGWRFLLRDPDAPPEAHPTTDGTPRAADAMLTADGWTFAHFCAGPYVRSTERALRQAESLPLPHQPRLLSVPRLYMLMLWLHRDPAADAEQAVPADADLLIPLAPAPPGIAPHTPQRADTLLPLLEHRLTAPPLLGTYA